MHPDSGADILLLTAAAGVAFLGLLSLRAACEVIRRAWTTRHIRHAR
jgi:hypothetical protein